MAEGVEGLTRDKTRKPGIPPLPTDTVQRVVDLALGSPPGETTHCCRRAVLSHRQFRLAEHLHPSVEAVLDDIQKRIFVAVLAGNDHRSMPLHFCSLYRISP